MNEGSDEWQLHLVSGKVRPTPGHPLYYEWQFGFLRLWLFADSLEDAKDKALAILEVLPYEQVGEQVRVESEFPSTEESRQMHGFAREQAEKLGLGIEMFAAETGTDEAGFEAMPLR